jgi:hypothetical protein
MKRTGILAFALALFTLSPGYSPAGLIILGNLPAENDAAAASVDAGAANGGLNSQSITQAFSFTMPAQDYPLERVAIRFRDYNTSAGDVAEVGLYLDNGNDLPGAIAGGLLVNPPSNSNDAGQFDFLPSAPLTLSASTKYWLLVGASSGYFTWAGSAPPLAVTSQVGATFGRRIFISGNTPRETTRGPNNFEITTTVPEPTSSLIVVALCLSAVVRRFELKTE